MTLPATHLDPYQIDNSLVEQPPAKLSGAIRHLGPGFVLSASVVGAGELVATTTLGAKAGFVALWVILVSCLVKVFVQLQFGRHTILTGQPVILSISTLPGPRWRGVGWPVWFWLLLQPVKLLQMGGVLGAVALTCHLAFPAASAPLWAAICALAAGALIFSEKYSVVEKGSLFMILAFTFLTLTCVIALQGTSYAFSFSDLAGGMTFHLPPEALIVAIGVFGLTGVGGDEIMHYTYWLIEKGYAARTGKPAPEDPAWRARARGWIRVMYFDAFASMLVYTVVTMAFYILGASVLHKEGLVPVGYQTVEILSRIYTESLGPWAKWMFLTGSFFVLFSTLFSALAAWTRMFGETAARFGLARFEVESSRKRTFRFFTVLFPILWFLAFVLYKEPVFMVVLGGAVTAALLVLVAWAALLFHQREKGTELKPGLVFRAGFFLSILAILAMALYAVHSAWSKASGMNQPTEASEKAKP